jgi:hypothetical protein
MNTPRRSRHPRLRISSQGCVDFLYFRLTTVGTFLCRRSVTPWIRLRGQWLKQAGFAPRSLVTVEVMPGRLELRLVTPTER